MSPQLTHLQDCHPHQDACQDSDSAAAAVDHWLTANTQSPHPNSYYLMVDRPANQVLCTVQRHHINVKQISVHSNTFRYWYLLYRPLTQGHPLNILMCLSYILVHQRHHSWACQSVLAHMLPWHTMLVSSMILRLLPGLDGTNPPYLSISLDVHLPICLLEWQVGRKIEQW